MDLNRPGCGAARKRPDLWSFRLRTALVIVAGLGALAALAALAVVAGTAAA